MIKVDCSDVEDLKHPLSVYVADKIVAIPSLKQHEFILSPTEDDKIIESAIVISCIKEFLYSVGKDKNFNVFEHEHIILIKSIS